MKKYFLLFTLFLALLNVFAQNYTVGVQSATWTDASRSNRSVPVEFHYPGTNSAIASDSFAFVVFGHGFDMTIDAYYNYADSLASHGYIVALTSNEGGLSPVHANLAQDLIYIYNNMISQSNTNSSSLLYHHVKPKGAISGHSMGGGCTVLSCQYSDTATCYWTLAEATTNPSSVTAAPFMHKPYLSFAGGNDCIAPASTNQKPTYDSCGSICKTLIEIKNATHCQFALSNVACNFGEGFSGCASTPLSRTSQTNAVLYFLLPYLDYYLNGNCAAWTLFESRYTADITDTTMQNCHNIVPANQAIMGTASFCNGSHDTLTAAPVGFNYLWSNDSTGANISISNPGSYSLTVSNGTCAVTTPPFIVTQNFPPATPSAITAADTVCSGIANIGISVTNDASVTTYNWTLPSGWSINSGNNTHAITAISGNTGGNISVTAQNICGTSSAVQKNIIVNLSGLAAPGAIRGDTLLCVGQPVQYVIDSVSGANSYVWNYPSDWTLASGSNTDSLILIAGTVTGAITVQAVNSCGQGIPSALNVGVKPIPVSGSITGTDSVCANSAGNLSFTLSNASGVDSIYWSLPNAWSIISGQGTTVVTVNNNQTSGAVNVTAYNVCGSANATPLNVNVIDTPQPIVTQANDTLITGAGNSYQWYLNGSAINGATSQNYNTTQNGNYTVAVTNAAGCTGTSTGYNYVYLSLNTIPLSNHVNIFPNPSTNGILQLLVSTDMLGSRLKVFDTMGRKIIDKQVTETNSTIDISPLSKGVYIADVDFGEISVKKCLVVE